MTVARSFGPLVNVGVNPALGRTTALVGIAGPSPYVSGINENPDAGPVMSFAGAALRDFRILSAADGSGLHPGGYPFQDFGFLMGAMTLTADYAPLAANATNIALAQGSTANVPLVLTAGAGNSVLTAPYTTPGGHIIPTGSIQLDQAPTYHAYGTSGALQAWNGNAMGRGVVIGGTGTGTFTIRGYDIYGNPITQTITGAGATLKGFKWVQSVIPSATNAPATAITVGTNNMFEFPLRVDEFCDVLMWLTIAGVSTLQTTPPAGFTPAVTTTPNTATSGDSRGTFTFTADGTSKICIRQSVKAANSDTVAGTFGVPMG